MAHCINVFGLSHQICSRSSYKAERRHHRRSLATVVFQRLHRLVSQLLRPGFCLTVIVHSSDVGALVQQLRPAVTLTLLCAILISYLGECIHIGSEVPFISHVLDLWKSLCRRDFVPDVPVLAGVCSVSVSMGVTCKA